MREKTEELVEQLKKSKKNVAFDNDYIGKHVVDGKCLRGIKISCT